MKSELEKKFDDLRNKPIVYKKEIVKIQNYKLFPSGNVVVNFFGGASINLEKHLVNNFFEEIILEIPENFTPLKADDFLDEKPVLKFKSQNLEKQQIKTETKMENTAEKNKEVATQNENNNDSENDQNTQIVGYTPTKENTKIKDALLDMLDKVSKNPVHISQAKAVCDIANTMVNIQKNEIALIQMMKKKSN